ncbi:MAG: polysaccharide deacetylase family protein [Candidatus Sumerlaeaceae bacterium]
MKALKILVGIFAVIGCLAIAVGGYYVYSRVGSGNLHIRNPINMAKPGGPATTQTLTSSNPENNSVLADYQRQMQTPVPGSTSGGPVQSAAQILAAKPIRTPDSSHKLIREWPTGRKWVALTFDDGPHPEWTPKFIDLLRSKGVKATFFLIGPNIEKNSELAKLLVESGFEVANHTMTHPQFKGKPIEKVREEISRTNDIIKEITGVQQVNAFRPPFGQAPKLVQDVCQELGLKIITWNIDTDDWRATTKEDKMTSIVLSQVKDGSIILMHDRTEKAYNTTVNIIDPIRAQGYEFVTVSELLGLKQPQAGPAAPAADAAAPAAGTAPLPTPASAAAAVPAATAVPTALAEPSAEAKNKLTSTPPRK